MMKGFVKFAKIISPVVKANKNQNPTRVRLFAPHPYTTRTTAATTFNGIGIPKKEYYSTAATSSAAAAAGGGGNNPCLDLYYKVGGPLNENEASNRNLKELLPLAWSQDSLTALKLICNLGHEGDQDLFLTALLWLHHNHPKTLACNVKGIGGELMSVGSLGDYVLILYQLLLEGGDKNDMASIDKKAVLERYERDPNYQMLHDRVSDVFADYLRSDIEKLNKLKKKKPQLEKYTMTAFFYPGRGCNSKQYSTGLIAASTLLCESIAKKVFPREDEAEYTEGVLRKLEKVVEAVKDTHDYQQERYLEDTKKASKSKIVADPVLPHELIRSLYHDGVTEAEVELQWAAVELQWKAMAEDLSIGKWNNCLVVCDVSGVLPRPYVTLGLGILFSELCDQELWKGKVVPYTTNPDHLCLNRIRGNDLWRKCNFLLGMDGSNNGDMCNATFLKVFDLILQEAVDANLKPENMIKKLLVFTDSDSGFLDWPVLYPIIQSNFEEKGYADVVPHIVFWELWNCACAWGITDMVKISQLPGVTIISGFSEEFLKLFLDKEGEVGSDHALEVAIRGKYYQDLIVVD